MLSKPNNKASNTVIATPNKQVFTWKTIWTLVCLLIITVLFCINYQRIFDEKIDLNGDNIAYYMLGQSLSSGHGFTNTEGYVETPHTHFPPGYPAFMALLMKAGWSSIHAIKVANGVLFYLSIILLFFILHTACDNRLIALTACAFTASHSILLRFSTIMMSESLYVFLAMIVMLIILKWDIHKAFSGQWKKWYKDGLILLAMALCLSSIYFVRVMGLSLILAVILYYGIQTALCFIAFLKTTKNEPNKQAPALRAAKTSVFKHGLVFGVVVLALIVPKTVWDIRDKHVGKASDDYASAFMIKVGGGTMSTVADWKERIISNTTAYITNWIPTAIDGNSDGSSNATPLSTDWFIGICVVLLLLWGSIKLPKGALLLFLYVGITMGVLLLFYEHYIGHRYMIPIIPFLIFLFIFGICDLIRLLSVKIGGTTSERKILKFVPAVVCLVFALIVTPTYAESLKRTAKIAKGKTFTVYNADPRFIDYIDAARWIGVNLPDSARVASRKGGITYIFSNGHKTGGVIPWFGTPEEVIEGFEKENINYVLIDTWYSHAYRTVLPAVQKYPNRFNVVYQTSSGGDKQPYTYIVQLLKNE
ncbi:hypothetical protein FACS1894201_07400 [Bacteroidia bacterium]|nr:hypothetical protein FACS1894201_07400 [Bacteroidia bacterium]